MGWFIVQGEGRLTWPPRCGRRVPRWSTARVGCPCALTSRARTLYACGLLLACKKEQTEELRKAERLPTRRSYLERVFGILDDAETQSLSDATKRLLREVLAVRLISPLHFAR